MLQVSDVLLGNHVTRQPEWLMVGRVAVPIILTIHVIVLEERMQHRVVVGIHGTSLQVENHSLICVVVDNCVARLQDPVNVGNH